MYNFVNDNTFNRMNCLYVVPFEPFFCKANTKLPETTPITHLFQ